MSTRINFNFLCLEFVAVDDFIFFVGCGTSNVYMLFRQREKRKRDWRYLRILKDIAGERKLPIFSATYIVFKDHLRGEPTCFTFFHSLNR